MNPQTPSLSDALALFAGLPDDVSTHVSNLLIWFRRSMSPDGYTSISHNDLALAMRIDDSTASRAFREGRDRGFIIDVEYGFRVGDRPVYSSKPPGSPGALKGRHTGRRCKINWGLIKEISDPRRVILTTQTEIESTTSPSGASGAGRDDNPTGLGLPSDSSGVYTFQTDEGVKGQNEGSNYAKSRIIDPSLGTLGEERKDVQELGTSFSCATTPADNADISALSADDWSALIARLNEIYREAQRRSGLKAPKNPVRGGKADRRLRAFVAKQEPIGRWSALERVANWFSFWVENHQLKNLDFPSSNFIREASEYRAQLEVWEAANPEARWREFPLEPTKPNLDDPNVQVVADFVYQRTQVTATTSLKKIIWIALQHHDVATLKTAFEYAFSNDFYSGGRDVRTKVLGFLDGDHIDMVLAEKRRYDEALAEAAAKRAQELKRQQELKEKKELESKQREDAEAERQRLYALSAAEAAAREAERQRLVAAEAERQRLAAEEEKARKLSAATEFLKTALQDGEFHPREDLDSDASAAGIDWQILPKAFATLGGVEREVGEHTVFGRPKEWQLPQAVGATKSE